MRLLSFLVATSILGVSTTGCSSAEEFAELAGKKKDKKKDNSQPSTLPTPISSTVFVTATGNGQIFSPEKCSDLIGAGGNYREGSTSLSGKCQNAGISPRIAGVQNDRYIEFGTNGSAGTGGNDRSELAYTTMLPFQQKFYVGYEFQLPAGLPALSTMFYALQLWQCEFGSPIAGMRIVRTAGTDYRIDFVTRHNNNPAGVSTHQYQLTPGTWHRFVIAAQPSVTGTGVFQVWADGRDLGVWAGNFGIANDSRCQQHFRYKWGIYKGTQPGANFTLRYTNFRIGKTYKDVNIP
jgi:hypothetical protein